MTKGANVLIKCRVIYGTETLEQMKEEIEESLLKHTTNIFSIDFIKFEEKPLS
jgi:hypothetical protein